MSQSTLNTTLSRSLKLLKEKGLKQTPKREWILQILSESHGPFSAEDLLKKLKNRKIDLVTIYRNLDHFEKLEIVRKTSFADGIARYELQSDETHHHHHVLCRHCGKLDVLDDCELQALDRVVKKLGYSQIQHNLEFSGLCEACQ